jgi:hypothetical protein
MVIANYIRTTSQGANWYEVAVNQMTEDLLQYFQERAMRKPDYCKITDDTISWCTSFEWADKLSLSTFVSKEGNLCLKCDPILSSEERRKQVEDKKKEYPTTKVKAVSTPIQVDLDDLPDFDA